MGIRVQTQSKKVNKAWLNQHVNDPYVQQALREGYRSRAVYKLQAIDQAHHLIRPGLTVVDLGSAPGAWSQYVRQHMHLGHPKGEGGLLLALDLLPMEPIANVHFIQGDFRDEVVLQQLEILMQQHGVKAVDVVLSDMAPNLSGIAAVDGAGIALLGELALDFAKQHLQRQGHLLIKTFQGEGFDGLVQQFRAQFQQVKTLKPKASRSHSSEVFLWGHLLR